MNIPLVRFGASRKMLIRKLGITLIKDGVPDGEYLGL